MRVENVECVASPSGPGKQLPGSQYKGRIRIARWFMADFIHVSTLAVWLVAVAVLSVAAGVPYGPILATICSLPLLILGMGLVGPGATAVIARSLAK